MNAHLAVEAYWAAVEARDWDTFGRLLADDVVYKGPQTRERVRGRDAYVRFNVEGFPGAWHLEVPRIVGVANRAASWIELTRTERSQSGLCFFELDETGLIARIHDFWPDPLRPPGRARPPCRDVLIRDGTTGQPASSK
jgi:hypothetical protein